MMTLSKILPSRKACVGGNVETGHRMTKRAKADSAGRQVAAYLIGGRLSSDDLMKAVKILDVLGPGVGPGLWNADGVVTDCSGIERGKG